ncbi:LOW QUALITY PROTEIN: hypothetical protein PHMEG_00022563, partial [Phytophthora megakarya]
MLAAGVIEEANGAWWFPVVLVRNKDGEVRFCVDYRALNAVTKKDVYPLPRIDETLEALGGALLFTTLDLRSGYWQIRVADVDKDKPAFTTRSGLYRFVRMPFGLSNAPSTFQRMMNSVLRGLTWSTCLVYLDDIILFTRGGIERHVLELEVVLERRLTVKLKKCVFATKSLEYLRHELGCDGICNGGPGLPTADEHEGCEEVCAHRWILPTLHTKLWVINGPDDEWAADQEAAFPKVKEILTTRPLLVYPNFTKPFRLETDASKAGLGACLMQECGDGWKPVAYASKVNSPTETNYGITELECAACGRSNYSDLTSMDVYSPLRSAAMAHDESKPDGKLYRWTLALQEYEFNVKYRPRSSNSVVDSLSRAPVAVSVRAAVRRRRRSRERTATRLAATDPEERDVGELRRQREQEPSLQLTDAEITSAQRRGRLVQRLLTPGVHKEGVRVGGDKDVSWTARCVAARTLGDGVQIKPRIYLGRPFTRDSYARSHRARDLEARTATGGAALGCGIRKARPREVVPSLRSLRGGAVGDRLALDVAGPLPASDGGQRYVPAAVEYVTTYAVATAVTQHTAESVARFLMKH